MLVEDEDDVLLTLKAILMDQGYDVDAFIDPVEALRHFVKLDYPTYELAILDITK